MIKWHKLQNPYSESKVAHYELLMQNTPHETMGYGAFVEYHRCRGLELKYMWIRHQNHDGKDVHKSFECTSFVEGKAMVVAFMNRYYAKPQDCTE